MHIEYALIGKSLGHSWSRFIHERIASYQYELLSMGEEDFEILLEERNFKGLNVTIPYKQKVIPYCDVLSPGAKAIGSVNVVYRDENGMLHGYNTDYYGLRYLCTCAGVAVAGKTVAVLGSGGTSKTAQKAAADMGAAQILVVSRNGSVNYDTIKDREDIEVLINTTPVGMYPNTEAAPLDLRDLPGVSQVVDVIYNPAPTKLIQQAQHRNLVAAGGLAMLVAQAKYTRDIFLGGGEPALPQGEDAEITQMTDLIKKQLAQDLRNS